jgi:hypothetical protein
MAKIVGKLRTQENEGVNLEPPHSVTHKTKGCRSTMESVRYRRLAVAASRLCLACEKPGQTRYKETPPPPPPSSNWGNPAVWSFHNFILQRNSYRRHYDEGNKIVTKMFRQCGGSGSPWISLQGPDFSGVGDV